MAAGGNFSTGQISISICDRCGLKMSYANMVQDRAKMGVWLHKECIDYLSPWQKPMQVTDVYNLQHPRPDAYLTYNYYVVNDSSPVIVGTSIGQYPDDSFAAGTSYQTAFTIQDGQTGDVLAAGPTSPTADQGLNEYLPPRLRNL